MVRTLKQLINSYRTDPESNFPKLQHQVRMKHHGELARLIEKHGSIQLRDIRFRTLTAWYRDWLADGKIATARSHVNRLRKLFRFGRSMLEDDECDRLFEALGKLQLEISPPRRVHMTADHARAICKTAREHFGWYSIALAQALQFELLLSQKDVIGEWVPLTEPGESDVVWIERKKRKRLAKRGANVDHGRDLPARIIPTRKWLRGLRWSDIDENLILRHSAGSSGRVIEVDLRTAPMVLEELKILVAQSRDSGGPMTLDDILEVVESMAAGRLPSSRTAPVTAPVTLEDLIDSSLPRSGPIIICEITGTPWSTAEFRRKWRLIAKEAGVPDNVTNRDSFPAGTIRGGPDRAKISQKYTLKRIDYSLRMARRLSEDTH